MTVSHCDVCLRRWGYRTLGPTARSLATAKDPVRKMYKGRQPYEGLGFRVLQMDVVFCRCCLMLVVVVMMILAAVMGRGSSRRKQLKQIAFDLSACRGMMLLPSPAS